MVFEVVRLLLIQFPFSGPLSDCRPGDGPFCSVSSASARRELHEGIVEQFEPDRQLRSVLDTLWKWQPLPDALLNDRLLRGPLFEEVEKTITQFFASASRS